MNFEDCLISTGIDSLIRLIQEKNKIDLVLASKLLNLPPTTIEGWAQILEKEGIIKVEHRAQKPSYMWHTPTKEDIGRRKAVFRKRKAQLKHEIKKMEKVQKIGKKKLDQYLESIQEIDSNFPKGSKKAGELSEQVETKKKELQKIRSIVADLNARSGMVEKNKKLLSKEARLIELMEEDMSSDELETKKKELQKIRSIVADLNARSRTIKKNLKSFSEELENMSIKNRKKSPVAKQHSERMEKVPLPPVSPIVKEMTKDKQIDGTNLLVEPTTTLSDVGGMEELKNGFKNEVEMFLDKKKSKLASKFGLDSSGGILLYGPPGVGKSHIVEAIAGEFNCKFMKICVADILSKWHGMSEKNMRAVFEQARNNQPVIMFFDEMEALGGNRADIHDPTLRSFINQFLIEMDDIWKRKDRIVVVGATNAPWHIDAALMRSGRFSKTIFVAPPDVSAREAIFRIYVSRIELKGKIDCLKLAKLTEGFSGANIEFVCWEAARKKYAESLQKNRELKVSTKDFEEVIGEPKGKKTDVERWLDSIKRYGVDADSFPDLAGFKFRGNSVSEKMFQ